MKYLIIFIFACLFGFIFISSSKAKNTITFPSKDGLIITADIYITNPDKSAPFIVLFHQAEWSRGEYIEIAPKLNEMGFNCIAVDQRSGRSINGVLNETLRKAKEEGKETTYVEALKDIEASLEYTRKNYSDGKIIAWGSSYSAALVLKIAGDNPDLVDGVLSFAPGEYFKKFGKSSTWIQESAMNINDPVFITSANKEKSKWSVIFDSIQSNEKVSYVPTTSGNHGSRALWEKFDDSQGYWDAVTEFLNKYFPR